MCAPWRADHAAPSRHPPGKQLAREWNWHSLGRITSYQTKQHKGSSGQLRRSGCDHRPRWPGRRRRQRARAQRLPPVLLLLLLLLLPLLLLLQAAPPSLSGSRRRRLQLARHVIPEIQVVCRFVYTPAGRRTGGRR